MPQAGEVVAFEGGSTPAGIPSLERLLRPCAEGRNFTARPIGQDLLEELHALMAVGPGMTDASPTRLLFLVSPSAKARLAKYLPAAGREAAALAPACALIGYDHEFAELLMAFVGDGVGGESCFDEPRRLRSAAYRNRVLQGAYLTLSARALGLDTSFFHGFDPRAVGGEFFPRANVSAIFAAALGFRPGPQDGGAP